MRIREVELRLIGLPLLRPFRTSFGVSTEKVCILVRVLTDDGGHGWGECVADIEPGFSEEFNEGAWLVLRDFLAPALLRADDVSHEQRRASVRVRARQPHGQGGPHRRRARCRAARARRVARLVPGRRADRVACGVSVGITATTDELRAQVDGYLAEGYRRIKLKIEPGLDVERVAAIRDAHPEILLLSVDANAAYTLEQVDVFRALDAFGLLMVEQPLHHDDLLDHAKLQAQIRTDLCLDESIRSAAHAAAAIELGRAAS